MSVQYDFGPFRLDPRRRVLTRNAVPLRIAPKPLALLILLLEERGRVVPRERILRRLWPRETGTGSNLSVNVAALRRALGERPRENRYIVTLPSRGYSFVAEVRERGEKAALPQPEPRGSHAVSFTGRRLAVLPFRALGGRHGDGTLPLGLADTLITQIAGLDGLAVRSPASVRRYQETGADPTEVGRDLHVDIVLEGSVTRRGDDLAVTVQLAEASEGTLLWAESYDGALSALSQIQDRIVGDLARVLRLPRRPTAPARMSDHPEAVRAYLRGRHLAGQVSPSALEQSLREFDEAVRLDRRFALAYAALADARHSLWWWGVRPGEEGVRGIEDAAGRALEIEPELAEARVWLANVRLTYRYDLEGSGAEFRRALAASPHSAGAHRYYAFHRVAADRIDEAVGQVLWAQSLEPVSPDVRTAVGVILFYARRFPEALAQFRTVTSVDSRFTWALYMVGWTLIQLEEYRAALDHFRLIETIERPAGWMHAVFAYIQGRLGRESAARRHLRALPRGGKKSFHHALAHLGLGEHDDAVAWLHRGFEAREGYITYVNQSPVWDPIREMPEFRRLTGRLGFPLAPAGEEKNSPDPNPPKF